MSTSNVIWMVSGIGTSSIVINKYKSSKSAIPVQAHKISYYSGLIYTCYVGSNMV